ncbi:MAG: pimeloyl-[acyl-carrier protein] methyl ester esterase [Candidatus Muproteobacteria bacterium RBG_16_62_13]|uniref:Pimeloyl-[acyl-carrier protein] methyl ester esterase n=1 Tax=Candidatus Muproteobacteria bacterium RBG_16_62_13 TaxID=1817756 RepID=A0A1F6T718_9PROT|nr:MAG: pimeloyl-[acyl-carrier protein] methyl ester esterase [Candidatus Muproteobacteria bacterium RBG_16_62_13]
MNIHIDAIGHGPDLVMLHGWGLDSRVFEPLVDRLARRHRLHLVDLPGYGHSRDVDTPPSMADLTDDLAKLIPSGAAWLGWSLGAQIALLVAQRSPAHIGRLILVAGTPCFVARAGWPAAMTPEVFGEFADGLQKDWRGTLTRFIGLLAADPRSDRDMLRSLRDRLISRAEPSPVALASGLESLRDNDLRLSLPALRTETLLIQGDRDRLVPPAAATAVSSLLPAARVVMIPGAGHAPFLSHPDAFLAHLESFLVEAA